MAPTTADNNKRIAKNTLALYFRMIITMLVSLYTSRIVLEALGVDDYGIYSVVGGVVIILAFLNNAMSGATQRFLNYEMGRNNERGLNEVFSTAVLIHIVVALVVLVLAETVGLWFLNTYMVFPPDRLTAANYVYQFSVAAFLVTVVSVPFNSAIIAHERMTIFAWISIIEVTLKLLIAYLILSFSRDRLIFYAFLMFLVSVVLGMLYGLYCWRSFKETKVKREYLRKDLFKQILSFSGWTVFGNLGYILHTQGIAICINMFFGAAVNAAQGISNQVNHAISGFVSNFQTALNPQIVKSYASGEINEMHTLICRGCRLSFMLISFFTVALIVEANGVLGIWLKTVPQYAVIFVQTVLLIAIFNSYSNVLSAAQGATGRIKMYQVVLTTVGALHLPLTILVYWLKQPPYWCNYIYLGIIIVLQIIRVAFVCHTIKMPLIHFFKMVVVRCLIVLAICFAASIALHLLLPDDVLMTLVKVCGSIVLTGGIIMLFGVNRQEKRFIFAAVKNKLHR